MKKDTAIKTETFTPKDSRAAGTASGLATSFTKRDESSGTVAQPPALDMRAIKVRQKATWESGDFGQIAKVIMPVAEEFMARLDLRPGFRVLDAACGTGNLAVIAARRGCHVSGLDIATNLIAQARARAERDRLTIDFKEGDVEEMPYEEGSFDAVVSMYGIMFAPQPDRVVSELCRVTKPGGLIALANWTPEGFIGKLFKVFARHLPPPAGLPSPLSWGDETVVRGRFSRAVEELSFSRRIALMSLPLDPAGTVDFFRRYYGPTNRAFNSLDAAGQANLLRELVDLQAKANVSSRPDETDTPSEYLEIQARRASVR